MPTADKMALIDALSATGLRAIEITSFVNPKWIPQLADAVEVASRITRAAGRGLLGPGARTARAWSGAARRACSEIAVFLSASETHNKKNVNKTIAATLEAFRGDRAAGAGAGLRVRAYVSTVFGCPYEGAVDPRKALELCRALRALGCYQVSLGDTIGVGNPRQVRDVLARVLAEIPAPEVAVHFHDTRGTALANILVGGRAGHHHRRRRAGRPGRLPVRARRLGQRRHRGRGLHAAGHGGRTGHRSGQADRLLAAGLVAGGAFIHLSRREGASAQSARNLRRFIGMAVISYDALSGNETTARNAIIGDGLALLGALSVVGYFIIGRKARARISLLGYVTPLYAVCSVFLLIWILGTRDGAAAGHLYPYHPSVWAYFAALAVVPAILGHTVFNWALKHVRPSAISLAFLGEPVVASVLAFIFFSQRPH